MSRTTDHGENVANQVQGDDAYGTSGELTDADIWMIVDNIHSAMMDSREPNDPIFPILERVMRELEEWDDGCHCHSLGESGPFSQRPV